MHKLDILANNKSMNNFYISENVQYVEQKNDNLMQVVAQNDAIDFTTVIASIPLVRKVVFYQLQSGEVIVGVLPEPLFSLSDRLNLMQNVEKAVSELTKKETFVTLDTDLFVAISKCSDEENAKTIKDFIIRRNSARM